MIEQFVEADHGSVRGYQDSPFGVVPMLREEVNTRAMRWGLAVQHAGVMAFARQILQAGAMDPLALAKEGSRNTSPWSRLIESLLGDFIGRPSRSEAEAYGTFLKTADPSEGAFVELAPRLSSVDAAALRTGQAIGAEIKWIQGSLARSLGQS